MTLPRTSSQSAFPDSTRTSRTPLSSKLDRKLIAYSAAASAASVGLLALTQTAEAKVVYTAANVQIPANTSVGLDFNNDGVPEFNFYFYQYGPRKPLAPPLGYHEDNLVIQLPKIGDEVWATQSSKDGNCVAALPAAAKVGPGAPFVQNASVFVWGSDGTAYANETFCKFGELKRGAFLGLKFLINGETHYGWAHVTVSLHTAVLNGYAYETVPNQPILTGKTNGPVKETSQSIPQIQPPVSAFASLGLLARGASALAIWRKPEDDQQN
jgi:hypothetical protein